MQNFIIIFPIFFAQKIFKTVSFQVSHSVLCNDESNEWRYWDHGLAFTPALVGHELFPRLAGLEPVLRRRLRSCRYRGSSLASPSIVYVYPADLSEADADLPGDPFEGPRVPVGDELDNSAAAKRCS